MTETGTRRRPTLYGRRKGPKLSAHQQQLRDGLLPRLTLALESGADPKHYFGNAVEEVWLEVGFGGGEHLLWQAQHHPAIGVIGAEPYEAGVAKLLSKLGQLTTSSAQSSSPGLSGRSNFLQRQNKLDHPHEASDDEQRAGSVEAEANELLGRIRIHEGDAREIIAALPDASLGCVFILFPDPWPKTRHHKRRFIQMEMLDALARVMKDDAELRFASDDAGYLAWALERLTAHPAFCWTAKSVLDWTTRPEGWPATRYEMKALHGLPAYLRFRRR